MVHTRPLNRLSRALSSNTLATAIFVSSSSSSSRQTRNPSRVSSQETMTPKKLRASTKKEEDLEMKLEEFDERKKVESPKKRVKHVARKTVNTKAPVERTLTSRSKRKLNLGSDSSEQALASRVQVKRKVKALKVEESEREIESDEEENNQKVNSENTPLPIEFLL